MEHTASEINPDHLNALESFLKNPDEFHSDKSLNQHTNFLYMAALKLPENIDREKTIPFLNLIQESIPDSEGQRLELPKYAVLLRKAILFSLSNEDNYDSLIFSLETSKDFKYVLRILSEDHKRYFLFRFVKESIAPLIKNPSLQIINIQLFRMVLTEIQNELSSERNFHFPANQILFDLEPDSKYRDEINRLLNIDQDPEAYSKFLALEIALQVKESSKFELAEEQEGSDCNLYLKAINNLEIMCFVLLLINDKTQEIAFLSQCMQQKELPQLRELAVKAYEENPSVYPDLINEYRQYQIQFCRQLQIVMQSSLSADEMEKLRQKFDLLYNSSTENINHDLQRFIKYLEDIVNDNIALQGDFLKNLDKKGIEAKKAFLVLNIEFARIRLNASNILSFNFNAAIEAYLNAEQLGILSPEAIKQLNYLLDDSDLINDIHFVIESARVRNESEARLDKGTTTSSNGDDGEDHDDSAENDDRKEHDNGTLSFGSHTHAVNSQISPNTTSKEITSQVQVVHDKVVTSQRHTSAGAYRNRSQDTLSYKTAFTIGITSLVLTIIAAIIMAAFHMYMPCVFALGVSFAFNGSVQAAKYMGFFGDKTNSEDAESKLAPSLFANQIT